MDNQNQNQSNNAAVIALVCGIVSIVISFFPYLGLLAIPAGIVAIVFGVKGGKVAEKKV